MNQRLIVVTGASKGLGRALVDEFTIAGHTVAGCARSEQAMDDLASAIGGPSRFDPVDVSDSSQVRDWCSAVVTECGPPDLVINNAALINENGSLWKVPAEEFSMVIDVNIKGVFHVIQGFLPSMIERGSGVIANLSSGWGRSTSPEVAPYCATKWAIEGLTSALAQEIPRGLAAVAVNPGVIDTEMLRSCFGANAGAYPSAAQWAKRGARFFLGLSTKDNGKSMTV